MNPFNCELRKGITNQLSSAFRLQPSALRFAPCAFSHSCPPASGPAADRRIWSIFRCSRVSGRNTKNSTRCRFVMRRTLPPTAPDLSDFDRQALQRESRYHLYRSPLTDN